MKQHVNSVAKTCFYHLRRLRQVGRRAGYDVTVRLVLAVVMSRIDYCNAVLAGLPAVTIEPLVRVQKAAARLVLQLGPRESRPRDECVTAAALAAHQSTNHINKLCVLMYAAHSGNSPAYYDSTQSSENDHSRTLDH